MLVIGYVVAYMYESYVGTAPFKVAYVDSKYRVSPLSHKADAFYV